METVKRSVVAKDLRGEREGRKGGVSRRWSTEYFRAVKLYCMILSQWIHDIINLSKPIELFNSKNEL